MTQKYSYNLQEKYMNITAVSKFTYNSKYK